MLDARPGITVETFTTEHKGTHLRHTQGKGVLVSSGGQNYNPRNFLPGKVKSVKTTKTRAIVGFEIDGRSRSLD